MPKDFVLPDLGEGITEAQIVRVLIKPGDNVAKDQYLVEVETDKAAVEIPSPYAGVASEVLVEEGKTVNVGDVLVRFDGAEEGAPAAEEREEPAPAPKAPAAPAAEAAAAPEAPAEAPPVPPKPIRAEAAAPAPEPAPVEAEAAPPSGPPVSRKTTPPAAPAVRKLAREMGIDLNLVAGSGPGGRITREDLERHAANAATETAVQAAPAVTPTPSEGPAYKPPPAPPRPGVADTDKWGPIRREPLNQIRKTIAKQMSRSASTIPHVTHCDEADITELERVRRNVNELTGGEPKLTAMSFLIRAICIAIGKYPIFNASFDEEGEQVIYKDYINMGIAVDTERGLIVPVMRNVDRLSLRGIAAELRTIADRIRTKQFGVEDLRGGTFTITNVGALGGVFTTPIINHPEVAILGLGRSRKVPVVRNDEIVQALLLPISLSFDHRATDGANAARFTREIISYLETPAKFLLD